MTGLRRDWWLELPRVPCTVTFLMFDTVSERPEVSTTDPDPYLGLLMSHALCSCSVVRRTRNHLRLLDMLSAA